MRCRRKNSVVHGYVLESPKPNAYTSSRYCIYLPSSIHSSSVPVPHRLHTSHVRNNVKMYTNALACALVAAHGAFAHPLEDSAAASITPTAEMTETIVRREGPTFSRTWTPLLEPASVARPLATATADMTMPGEGREGPTFSRTWTQASPATTSPGASASTTETFGNPYEGARFTRTRSLHVVHVPRATLLAGSSPTENVGIEVLTRGGLRTTSPLLVSVSLATSSVSSSVHSGGAVEIVGLGPRETSIRTRVGTPMHSTTKAHSPKWPILPRETAASEVPVIEDDAADYIALVKLGLAPNPLVYEQLNLTGTKLSARIEVERRSGDDGGDQIDMGIDEHAKIGKELTPLAKFIVKNSDHVGSQFCYDYFVNKRDPGML